jgi:hypothetical protein
VFELARVMGTSAEMIERHCGAVLDGSGASRGTRPAVFEAEQERAAARPFPDVEWIRRSGHDWATQSTADA